jgi:hypothetical protein
MDPDTKKMLEEILATVKGLDSRVSKLEAARSDGAPPAPTEKKLSIKEFLLGRAPSNANQMTLAIAFYLEQYEGITPVNAADLERGFRSAREAVPANINDQANKCVKYGYFMEHDEKKSGTKAWQVTRTGDEFVRAGFGKGRS